MTYYHFLFLSGLMLSSVAAVFSVHGLAEMFSASYWSIVIMASVLELCKLVTASWLYNRWDNINRLFRVYLASAVVVLMLITSGGIFGVLSKAYLEKAQPNTEIVLQLNQVNKTIENVQGQISRNDKVLSQLNAQVDSLIGSGDIDKSSSIRAKQSRERNKLNLENASLTKELNELSSQKNELEFKRTQAESDIGPLKYLAAALYGSDAPVDKAVQLMIFALILVFDPLAVVMMMSATKEIGLRKEKIEIEEEEESPKLFEVIVPLEVRESIDPEVPVTHEVAPEVTPEVIVQEETQQKKKSKRGRKPKQMKLDLPEPEEVLTKQESSDNIAIPKQEEIELENFAPEYKFNHVKQNEATHT